MVRRGTRHHALAAALLGALCALALACAPAGALETTVLHVDVGSGPNHGLSGIAAGPDGNIWFSEASGRIGFVTPAGVATEYTGFPTVFAITAGPDRRMWFFEYAPDGPQLGWVTLDGAGRGSFTTHAEITGGDIFHLTSGPDGALWFTRSGGTAYNVARMTTDGALTNFMPSYRPPSLPGGIATGPDGALWYAETGRELAPERPSPSYRGLVRITTAGAITPFPLRLHRHPPVYPLDVVGGPDGALWFTAEPATIGRMTTAGRYTLYDLRVPRGDTAGSIVAGPDGNLWFAVGGGRIGRITRHGHATIFRTPSREAGPGDLAVGPEGNLWMTAHDALVKIVPPRGRCMVPRLVGLRFAAAKRRLQRAHCAVGRVVAPHRDRLVVRTQAPHRGTRLPAESPVDLRLGRPR